MSGVIRKIVKGKKTGRYYLKCCGARWPIYGTGHKDGLDWDTEYVEGRCGLCWFTSSWGVFRDGSTEAIRLTAEEKARILPSPEERRLAAEAHAVQHPPTMDHIQTCRQCMSMTISISTFEIRELNGKVLWRDE